MLLDLHGPFEGPLLARELSTATSAAVQARDELERCDAEVAAAKSQFEEAKQRRTVLMKRVALVAVAAIVLLWKPWIALVVGVIALVVYARRSKARR